MSLRVIVVDDHLIFREGLRVLLEREEGIDVVADAGSGVEAVRLAGEYRPDAMVMDVTMPDMNGIDATKRIAADFPEIRIVALSMESDRRFVVEVLKSGALGYVLKDSAFAELANAIRTVAAGEPYLGPKITHLIIRDFIQRIPHEKSLTFEVLTQREREVLQLIADGKNPKEIAFAFNVSYKTVENQRHCIMKKLNLYSIAELTKYAIREGLSSLNQES